MPKPEETKTETLPASDSELPEAFTKAIDAIDAEKEKSQPAPAKAEGGEDVSKKDETAEPVSQIPAEGEEVETPPAEEAGGTPPETELSAEDAEIINGLDPEVVETLSNYGWSNEKIAREIRESPELADDIREALDEEEAKKGQKETAAVPPKAKEQEAAIEELKLTLDPDVVGADVKTALDKIVETLNVSRKEAQQIRTELLADKQEIQKQKDAIFNERIDKCFDRYTKQIPTLGKSFSMSKYNQRVRNEIYGYAMTTSQVRRIPIERAIEQEIHLYPYRNMKPHEVKDKAKQEILDDLNKQEKRFTNPPARSPSKLVQKQFGSTSEEADYRIRQIDDKYAG